MAISNAVLRCAVLCCTVQQVLAMLAVMQSLTPPQLAGVLGAILTSENISKPQMWVAYEPTAPVVNAIQALEADREQLYKVQVQHAVQAPLAIDLRLAGKDCWLCTLCTGLLHKTALIMVVDVLEVLICLLVTVCGEPKGQMHAQHLQAQRSDMR